MIYQNDVENIVMLTRLFEGDTVKCLQYWPDEGSHQQYGEIKVTLVHVDTFAEYNKRTLAMRMENNTKQVTQFQFTAWPDKEVPEAASSIVQFWHKVRNVQSRNQSPTVVHCSAGIDRTGIYIALDYLLYQGKDKHKVYIFPCVAQLRKQRVNLVQTEALVEALLLLGYAVSAEFPSVYQELLEIDRKQRKTGLLLEFEKLQTESNKALFPPQEDNDTDGEEEGNESKSELNTNNHHRTSRLEINKHKNRYNNSLPSDECRAYLSMLKQPHGVRHIQCTLWPGSEKVPLQTDTMLTLIVGVDEWQRQAEIKTVVVHCVDGAERSGLYCVLSTVLEGLNEERDVAIYRTVKKMMTRRQQIIPNYKQYKYCHDVVLEYLGNFGTYSNLSEI